jgi:hypothetical protein
MVLVLVDDALPCGPVVMSDRGYPVVTVNDLVVDISPKTKVPFKLDTMDDAK